MTHKGNHCTVFLSDLEKLAHDTAAFILNKPHMSKEELAGYLQHEFVRAQGMYQSELKTKLAHFENTVNFLELYGDSPDSELVKRLNAVMERLKEKWEI